jgi:hypothetical protein
MVFRICIKAILELCSQNGKLFFYDKYTNEKVYNIPSITVPQEYRKFVNMTEPNPIFEVYVSAISDENYTSIEHFLNFLPRWCELADDYEGPCDWHKKDHLEFMMALEWFAGQPIPFTISWSF